MQASAGDFILGEVRFDFVKNLFLFFDLFLMASIRLAGLTTADKLYRLENIYWKLCQFESFKGLDLFPKVPNFNFQIRECGTRQWKAK